MTIAGAILVATAVVAFAASTVVRRALRGRTDFDHGPWTSTLGYLATAFGVILGFSTLLLFSEVNTARNAVGAEARSIGTAFDEAQLFPQSEIDIQHALICYARAVTEFDWPALESGGSSPVVERAYSDIFVTLGEVSEPTDGTFQPATATNLVVQLGNVSTARGARIVAAELQLPTLLWWFLVFGGSLVLTLIFIVTLRTNPTAQAVLVGLSAAFTAAMLLIVVGLSSPFGAGAGRVSPELIEETTASMEAASPDAAAMACSFEARG